MSSTAILLVPILVAPAFGVGIWLGVRSVTDESSVRHRYLRCTPVSRLWPDSSSIRRPGTWQPPRDGG